VNIVLAITPKLDFSVKNEYDIRVWDLNIVGGRESFKSKNVGVKLHVPKFEQGKIMIGWIGLIISVLILFRDIQICCLGEVMKGQAVVLQV